VVRSLSPSVSSTSLSLRAADVVRLVGVACVAYAVLWRGPVEVALFSLVLFGLVLPRLVDVGPTLDLAYGVVVLVAAWSSVVDVYGSVLWWDLVVHLVATGLVAAVCHRAMVRTSLVPAVHDPVLARPEWGAVLVVTALGLALGVLWEVGEWYGHTYLDDAIFVGYDDTIGDLVAGGCGALLAGMLLARRPSGARRRR
jgi:hypothetical protein